MKRTLLTCLLVLGTLLGASQVQAQSSTRDQIRMIESEYARINNGRMINDNQLEYYIDRSNAGWSMNQISRDMTLSRQAYSNRDWRPATGWTAREVVCSSVDNRYNECPVPFRGTAVITQQISKSACIEGQTWGQKAGAVWVRNGCRARFGITRNTQNPVPGNNRMVVCASNQDRYRECATGFRGRVQLVNRLNNSQACVEGRSWGQREGVVWVRNGCRAQFQSIGRRGPRDDYENRDDRDASYDERDEWRRDDNYSVTCSSIDGRRSLCTWDPRYGTPRLVQRISTTECLEGRDWGYDNRGQLWVDAGCRARFGYR